MNNTFPHLFEPLRVNGMMLKNRIIAAPMGIISSHRMIDTTNYGGMSGYDRSLGGCAMVHICCEGENIFDKYQLDITREQWSVAKQNGALVSCEVGLFSPVVSKNSSDSFGIYSKNSEDAFVYAPSAGVRFDGFKMKELDRKSMDEITSSIVNTCLECKKFGFDSITLHFGHDSLCSQFLSPIWNKRTDQYGGSIENRGRFPKEVLEKIREAVGPTYPLILRVSRQLIVKETYEEDDMLSFLKSVESLVDMVNISCGMDVFHYANVHAVPTIFEPHEYNKNFAKRVKENTSLLVCIVGAVMSPDEGEELIKEGYTDACMYGRSLIADPYWPKKAYEGKTNEIVPCVRCMNCYHIATSHWNVQCSVNPRFRRENRVPIKLEKTNSAKNVVVVGGGPAGMKAAISAYEKGHNVTIVEKYKELGGALRWATNEANKEDLKHYEDYLINKVNDINITLMMNTFATKEVLSKLKPDVVIIAIGSEEMKLNIPGAEKAMSCTYAIDNKNSIGKNVVIIGGGSIGCELALDLAHKGKNVTIVEMSDKYAGNGNMLYREALKQHIESEKNLTVLLSAKSKEILDNKVIVEYDGKTIEVDADTTIVSIGFRPKKDEAMSMYGITGNTCMVGDCLRVASVLEATNEGYFVGSTIE